MGVVSSLAPKIKTQVGKLCLSALLESGSARSLIPFEHFQQMRHTELNISLMGMDCTGVTASGQSLEIMGQVKVPLKIQEFSWSWSFLVSRKLKSQPILGADFIVKTKMVLNLGNSICYFVFNPSVYINFTKDEGQPSCSQTNSLPSRLPHVQMGQLSPGQKEELERLINQYPNVLSKKFGLIHIMEYEIQLLDNTPVRLTPYRLSPPKMQYLRNHIKTLLREEVIEPSFFNYSSPLF
jgi:hypothetical protein